MTRRRARRSVGLVLVAGLFSMLGDCMTLVAAPWLVLTLTGSALSSGLVAAAEALATVLASALLAGPIVDRLGGRRPAIYSELAAAGVLAAATLLVAAGSPAVLVLVGLVALKATVAAPGTTAAQRLLPRLAATADVDPVRVNAGYWLLQRVGLLLGAPLAAGVLTVSGAAAAFALNAMVFLAAAALTACALRGDGLDDDVAERSGTTWLGGYLGDLRAGLRAVVGVPLLRTVLGFAVVLNLFDAALVPVTLPVLVEEAGDPATRLGLLVGCYAAGSLLGTLASGLLGSRLPVRLTVVASLSTSAGAHLLIALRPGTAAWAVLVLGVAAGPLLPVLSTLLQRTVPPTLLGRVTGTLFALMLAASPAGRVLAGAVLDRFPPSWFLAASGVAFLVTAALLGRAGVLPAVLPPGPQDEPAQRCRGAGGRPGTYAPARTPS